MWKNFYLKFSFSRSGDFIFFSISLQTFEAIPLYYFLSFHSTVLIPFVSHSCVYLNFLLQLIHKIPTNLVSHKVGSYVESHFSIKREKNSVKTIIILSYFISTYSFSTCCINNVVEKLCSVCV